SYPKTFLVRGQAAKAEAYSFPKPSHESDSSRAVAQRLSIPQLKSVERSMVKVRRHTPPRHGTDHDPKPLPSTHSHREDGLSEFPGPTAPHPAMIFRVPNETS